MAKRRTTRAENTSDVDAASGTADEVGLLRQALAAAGAPDEVLRMLDAGGPDEIFARLAEADALPTPDDALPNLIAQWTPLLARGVDPLTAEISGLEFVAAFRSAEPDPDRFAGMLTALVEDTAAYGGAAALAFLRTMAAVGPATVRPTAAEAADRLVAGGLTDRPWVKDLGNPKVGTCFGYRDDLGAQETVAVTFRYGRREHAIAVLIDHDLGGGVKDCWPTDEPDQIRAAYRASAAEEGLRFADYQPAEARAILHGALEQPPCPVEPDQVEDVDMFLDLVRSRAALLPDAGPYRNLSTRQRVSRKASSTATVHRLKVSLHGARPPIWRRIEVPSDTSLHELHLVIQAAFGWENYHMWMFENATGRYGIPDRELDIRSAATRKIRDVAARKGSRLDYTYDFGDNWEHSIVVEEVRATEAGISYPRCLAGRRTAPPEDCGGIWGYEDLIEILADPTHEEHAERLEWLGLSSAAEFDPAHFDLEGINQELAQVTAGRR
ncbi:plasmid pRiA4b ORF-3 family protein [Polymorphospora sp. NPDC050346]|uniref:plasmid pRiA4b ORF-3 family protein n=1 Tax=Polymorphospora sp. NPDC050346 TaxID=3155780 RepID=UPI0033DF719B